MRCWLGLLGVSAGGKAMALVRERTRQISTCRFAPQIRAPGVTVAVKNSADVDEAVLFDVDASAGPPVGRWRGRGAHSCIGECASRCLRPSAPICIADVYGHQRASRRRCGA